jgi:catechol 2,3-dioxygenase-like lactoylglutathione lyase family enzyme
MIEITCIDHVQLAMPKGEEPNARRFYVDVLGMTEHAKPDALAARGGVWFSQGAVQIHLGVEEDFRPARKAHVALAVKGAHNLRTNLAKANLPVREDRMFPGMKKFYTEDTFGNRIEIIELD